MNDSMIKNGTYIKTRFGVAKVLRCLPKDHPMDENRYMIKLDKPDPYYHQARTHFYNGKPTKHEAGILFFFENEFRVLDLKQGELF